MLVLLAPKWDGSALLVTSRGLFTASHLTVNLMLLRLWWSMVMLLPRGSFFAILMCLPLDLESLLLINLGEWVMLFFILMSPHFIVVSNCFSGLVLHFVLGKDKWIGCIIKRWVLIYLSYLSPLISVLLLYLRDGLLLFTMVTEGRSSVKIWRSNLPCAYDRVFFSLPNLKLILQLGWIK